MRFLFALALTLVACDGLDEDEAPPSADVSSKSANFTLTPPADGAIADLILEDGEPPDGRAERTPPADATPLSAAETAALLKRLPPVQEAPGDQVDFARRDDSLPPPKPGEVISAAFPPPPADGPPPISDAPLEVLRWAPDGDVLIAPQLSVTFSQPMVAVGTVDMTTETLPVELSPQPPGQWRWIGTQTLLFEPDGQFPKATSYTVRVPQGTASANGGVLDDDFSASFSTPPIRLVSQTPLGDSIGLTPLIWLRFDQAVDLKALLPHIQITADGKGQAWRPASAAELKDAQGLDERTVVITPKQPLPRSARVAVQVKAGAPSAEGPRKTTEDQGDAFFTYGPLIVKKAQCGYRDRCRITNDFRLTLSNPVDVDAFEVDQVTVSPEIERMTVYCSGDTIFVDGLLQPETTYTVTLDAAIQDDFAQTLEGERTFPFTTDPAEDRSPRLGGFPQELIVLDPAGGGTVPLRSLNMAAIKLRIYRVTPEDWPAYVAALRDEDLLRPETMPGTLLETRTIAPHGMKNEEVITAVDLSAHLDEGIGQLMLWAEPMKQPRQRYRQQHALSWVQGTEIALTAVVDRETLIGWAAQLEDGASIEGASLSLFPVDGAAVKTDASGLGEIEVPTANAEEQTILIARKGGDVAFIPEREGRWYGGARWVQRSAAADLLWFIFDDRQLYRPGETVQVKGWIRAIDRNEGGDTTAAALGDAEVAWQLLDSRRNEVAKGTTSLTRLGGFDLALALPDTINLGYGQLVFRVPGHTERSHSIRIEAFRRPEFEVSVNAPPDVVTLGDEIVLTASASYYAGGVLPGAVVGWSAEASTTTFTPPNRDEYRFGKWTPWWLYRDSYGGSLYEQFSGKTDASGAHRLSLRAESLANPRPLSVVVSASVTDVNRQTFSGSKTILIHPSSVYVGVKPSRPFYPGDMPVKLDLIAVDVAGNLEAGHPIAVEIVRKTWGPDKAGRWVESVAEEHACSVTSATSARDCTFTPESGGSFEITARVTDDLGRPNETVSTVWVSGGEAKAPRRVGASSVTLVPDKETYVPGDVAEILVQSPITPAEVLVTVRRSGVVHTERHRLDASGLVLNVPIRDEYVPNVFVQVDVVGGELRRDASGEGRADLPQQPAYGTGELNLSVSTLRRALTVAVTPASSSLVPGGETPLRVTVTDADGQPVSDAEVVVVAVDESVLALTGYKIGDPLAAFYPQRPEDTRETWLHRWVYLEDPEDIIGATGAMAPPPPDEIELEEAGFMPMGGALAPPAAPSPATGVRRSFNKPAMLFAMADRDMGQDASGGVIAVRSNFDPLAMFVPAAVTDTKGEARLRLEVPDNLTRYRITAIVAAGENRFGSAESTVTARLPLMIRPAAPRFLNFGDRFELPVVVQNQTDEPMAVSLAVQATNALFTDDPSQGAASSGRRLTVAAGDRAEVRFPAKTDAAGTARFQVAVSAGDFSDAAEVSLPVWTPATSEAFATYGVLDNDGGIAAIRQPVVVPDDVFPQFGGLEVTTSTTAVGALTDAVIHLVDYPYGCSEQIASRVLAVAALRDVLTAFDAEGLPDAEALSANVTADLEELRSRQNPDGGFGFWRQGEESWPFLTLHVAHAVVRAKEKGYAVDSRMEARLMTYLQDIQRRFPSGYGPEIRRVLEAYAVYIRHLDGDVDGAAARRLVRDLGADKGALEALGWLLPTLHQSGATQSVEAILRRMNNQVSETAAAAHFVTRYTEGDDLILHSNRRTDGILLDALVRVRPESPLIPKLVEGVLGDRTRGQWGSTQDNAFVLLAMDRYFRTFEGTTPDLVARVWLGDRLAGSQTFQGRSTDKAHINAPMAWMQEAGGDVIMSHEGVGRLYYRIGMRYAPRSLELEPREAGFAVTRTYEAVDEPEDVIANPDGSWTVRAGARVRARVTMAAPGRRSHVALVDPLPAGFEVLNPELAMTESLPPPGSPKTFPGRWWWGPWYSYENLRDERVEAFATRLWGGVYEYTYVARATTPGVFVVPPAKAEEMYHPETFGRTGTVRVAVVEP